MSSRTMHKFDVTFIRETDMAILVEVEGDEFWLPKSQIDWLGCAEEGDEIEVRVPEWLAEEKELM